MTYGVVMKDGFDFYNGTSANGGLQTHWVIDVGSSGAVSMTSGRFGGQAVRNTPFALRCSVNRPLAVFPSVHNSITIGCSVRFANIGANTGFLWACKDGASGTQVMLTAGPGGLITASRGHTGSGFSAGTNLAVSAPDVIRANTWHFVELITTINSSTGTLTVKVDGATVIGPLSSQNTQAQAAAGVNWIVIGGNGAIVTDHDDLYVLNNTTPIGEARIESLRANADTATADWTPNTGVTGYTQVDDTTANGDTDYIQSTNVGDVSTFEMSDLSTTPTTIFAVTPVVFAEKTDAATRQLAIRLSSGGTDTDGTAVNLAASYNAYGPNIYETDPHDSNPWTKAKVDAIKVGPKVAA